MIIDAHTHIFSPKIIAERDYYCSLDACFSDLYSDKRAKIFTVEELIKEMDEKEISRSIVLNIGWINHDVCVINNDYILEAIAKYSDRLIGFCSIQPRECDRALKELERCLKCGVAGIGELRPDIQGYDLNDELMSPVIELLTNKNAVLLFHASEPVGHYYSGKGNMTPGILYEFVTKNTNIKIILAHFGGGLAFYELMPEVQKMFRNVYYDTAAAPFLYSSQIYKVVENIDGCTKLLYGSDWPLLDQRRVIKHIQAAGLEREREENIFFKNAIKVLNLNLSGHI